MSPRSRHPMLCFVIASSLLQAAWFDFDRTHRTTSSFSDGSTQYPSSRGSYSSCWYQRRGPSSDSPDFSERKENRERNSRTDHHSDRGNEMKACKDCCCNGWCRPVYYRADQEQNGVPDMRRGAYPVQ